MAYPNDLDDVEAIKIHPAIGVARLANNDDYYEFFDYLGLSQKTLYCRESLLLSQMTFKVDQQYRMLFQDIHRYFLHFMSIWFVPAKRQVS